jgi:hypothetical protein
MILLNAIFPVFALLFLGTALKQTGITNEIFLKTSDKLVYYIFFPVMLFWKIGSASPDQAADFDLCSAAILAVGLTYLLSLFAIRLFHIPPFQAGSFSQACYRFNTYIGMAIVMNTYDEEGVRLFGILIGFAIPVINLLAVSTLIWFSGKKEHPGQTIKSLLMALISNPLILGCAAGLLFSRAGFSFPGVLENTFSLMTAVTMPLALISIGGSLTLAGLKNDTRVAILSCVLKLFVLPVLGYLMLRLFSIDGLAFRIGMIFFALPTSTAIYVLCARMDSDTKLASAAILLSTLLSIFSLSAAILI